MQKRFVFATGWPDAIGDLGKLDCTQYVGDNGLCIDHLQHTEAHDIVEQMCDLQEDGALLISDDEDATFQEVFIGAHCLIIK